MPRPPTLQVICESCDVGVHQLCYGVDNVPEGPWYCDTCRDHVAVRRWLPLSGWWPPLRMSPTQLTQQHCLALLSRNA